MATTNPLQAPGQNDPWAWSQWASQQDPGTYGALGPQRGITIEDLAPYRQTLEQAGLWNPEWNAYAGFQQASGDADMLQAPTNPNISALQGYQVASNRGPGDTRFASLYGPDGSLAGQESYQRESTGLDDYLQAATIVGGGALGANALFGGLGAGLGGSAAAVGGEVAGAAGAAGGIGGGGLTAGAGSLYAPSGFAAGGSALGGATAAAGGAGGLMGTLGSVGSALGGANSLANLGSAAIGLVGQGQALGAMKDATQQSNDFNRYAFDQIRADNKPLVDLRNSVLPQISGLLSNPGSVMQDPGNQFQFAQGEKALQNGAAARGMTYSGAQGKALTRYGQDFASTKLDDSLRRLQSVAGLGQVGSNSNNAATQNYANSSSDNALSMGSARGSVYGNMANIGGNALGNIFNNQQYRNIWGTPQ